MSLSSHNGNRCWLTVVFIVHSFTSHLCLGYHRTPCSQQASLDFSFPDCYVPDQNENLLLSEASFLFAHDAATGYIKLGVSKAGLSSFYSKTQLGTLYDQLNNGARALDLRPWLYNNGTVAFHHGAIRISTTFESALEHVTQWVTENPTELVLLLTSHFGYENSNQYNDDAYAMVNALKSIYAAFGITYLSCVDIEGWTVGEAMEVAAVANGQGYVLALDGNDFHGSFCGKQNWIESEVVTCWGSNNHTSCKKSNEQWDKLQAYALASANNEASDDNDHLGPPASTDIYPFNEIQALWQVDALAVAMGLAHFSSILEDNKASNVNAKMVDLIYDEQFKAISLFAVDNVAVHGNALLSVLRNTCGQSDLDICGHQIPKPPMKRWRITKLNAAAALVTVYALALLWVFFLRRPKLTATLWARLRGQGNNETMLSQELLDEDEAVRQSNAAAGKAEAKKWIPQSEVLSACQ